MPELLTSELAEAEALGVNAVKVGAPKFENVVNSGTIKWSLNTSEELFVIPKFAEGTEISHTVLTQGRPVLAAGEAEIAAHKGVYQLIEINNHSGHYRPSSQSLWF